MLQSRARLLAAGLWAAILVFSFSPLAHSGTALQRVEAAAADSAYDVALSPGGEHLYAASRRSGSLLVYERDAFSGDLSFVQSEDTGVCTEGLLGSPCQADADCLFMVKGRAQMPAPEKVLRRLLPVVDDVGECRRHNLDRLEYFQIREPFFPVAVKDFS